MFMAAAHALAATVDAKEIGDSLLPPLTEVREVSRAIALAVAAQGAGAGPGPDVDAPRSWPSAHRRDDVGGRVPPVRLS